MKRVIAFGGVLYALALTVLSAQSNGSRLVNKLDPGLDAIVPANAKLDILIEDYFGSIEGPVWMNEGKGGFLLFSDQAANRVYKWDGKLSVFLEPSGYTGDPAKWSDVATFYFNQRLHIGLIGSNGLALDREGRLILCARGDRALVRLEKDRTRTTLAKDFQGKAINPPNDLTVKSDGSIYFSTTGSTSGITATKGLPADVSPNGIYRWKDGKVDMLTKSSDGISANGLAFSPDEKFLYVAGGKISRYTVQPDGTLTDGKFFAGESEADGMKVDSKGNLYFMGPGGLWIVSPEGKHLGTVAAPLFRNLAFGDADHKTLYLTIQRGLARIRLNIPG